MSVRLLAALQGDLSKMMTLELNSGDEITFPRDLVFDS